MSQNTLRQLIILGICALFAFLALIYQKREAGGWMALHQWDADETESSAPCESPDEDTQNGVLQIAVPGGNPEIRVLICSDNYESEYHQKLTLRCSTDYTVSYGNVTEEHKASEEIWFTPDDPWLEAGAVTLEAKDESGTFTLPDLVRSQESPAYSGKFIVERNEEGIRLINVLPLETYLCCVVPSEMPSDYPLEALKAQAICARTYALKQISKSEGEDTGADLDDSTSYQVYNNVARNERTDQAVRETAGQVLMMDGSLIDAMYYSTSCGIDLSQDMSDEAVFCAFMSGVNEKAYEKDEPWYRWSAYFSLEELTELVKSGWQADFGAVTEMEVAVREENGAAGTLLLSGEGGTIQVSGEYSIRKLLRPENAQLTLQDGSTAANMSILPSAFFYLTPKYEDGALTGYTLTGGGYGHGQGMSQNGAKSMAESGYMCTDILRYYYEDDTRVKSS